MCVRLCVWLCVRDKHTCGGEFLNVFVVCVVCLCWFGCGRAVSRFMCVYVCVYCVCVSVCVCACVCVVSCVCVV